MFCTQGGHEVVGGLRHVERDVLDVQVRAQLRDRVGITAAACVGHDVPFAEEMPDEEQRHQPTEIGQGKKPLVKELHQRRMGRAVGDAVDEGE